MGNPYDEPLTQTPVEQPSAASLNPYDSLAKEAPKWDSGRKQHAPISWGDTVADIGKNLQAGSAEGTGQLSGMWGSARKWLADTGEALYLNSAEKAGIHPDKIEELKKHYRQNIEAHDKAHLTNLPTITDIDTKINEAQPGGHLYQSQSDMGDYARSIGQQLPQAAFGPVHSLGRYALGVGARAVLPGVATEGTHKLLEGSDLEPAATTAAGIVTGGVGHALTRPGSVENYIRPHLRGVTDQQFAAAESLIKNSPIPLTQAEALSQVTGRSILTNAQRIAESSPHSRNVMDDFMATRPEAIKAAGRQVFDSVAPQSNAPSSLGPTVAAAAEKRLNEVRQSINKVAEPYYNMSASTTIKPNDMVTLKMLPTYNEAVQAIRSNPALNRYVGMLPENSVGFVDAVKKFMDKRAENLSSPITRGESVAGPAGYKSDASVAARTGIGADQNYETALNIEQHGREKYLDPLMKGPLGRIAEQPDTKKVTSILFDKKPFDGSDAEVGSAVKQLANKEPMATSQLVRGYLATEFSKNMQKLQGGNNQFGGAKFAANVAGGDLQKANLKAAVEALPNGAGKWDGFEKYLNELEATGQRKPLGSLTEFNKWDMARMERGTALTEGAKFLSSPEAWMSLGQNLIGHWRLGRNVGDLAHILTDQKAGPLLQQIARTPVGSDAMKLLTMRLTAIVASNRKSEAQ